jgi:fermentation-respiration switch protein FrsA (DUF1100 family)
VVYAVLCLLVYLIQRRLIYFPVRWSAAEESRLNPGYEAVFFRTADGERLHGWLHRRAAAPWTVIVFHGNAGNLSWHSPVMAPFTALGLQVLLFDYRGFGRSTGRPTEAGLIADGEAASSFVESVLEVPRERIVFFGQSLGTGVAVNLAARRAPGRLILESAFDSLASVARHHYFYLPVRLLLSDRFDSAAVVGRISCPVLFLHPGEDEIIPVAFGRALFAKVRAPKRFVLLPGAHHNDALEIALAERHEALREFLAGSSFPSPANPP